MDNTNQNPFTIGKPFNIEFEDSTETKQPEAETQEEPQTETKEETSTEPVSPTPPEATPSGKIEIEDILDREVAFEDSPTPPSSDKETQQAQEAVKEALLTDDDSFDYGYVAKKLIESGFWEDFENSGDVEIDKDVFEQLSKQQDTWKSEKLVENIYSSFSPAEKEFLAFKQSGGDLEQYYQSKTAVDRINNLDISTDQGKVNAVYTYYKNFVGWDDQKINKHIQRITKDMDLDEEAQSAFETIQHHVVGQHQQMLQQQEMANQQRNQAIDNFKKDIKSILKASNFDSRASNRVVKGLTNLKEESGLAEVDEAYLAFRNDPQRAVLLYSFLTDYEGFVNNLTASKQKEVQKKVFMDIKKAKKTPTEKKDFSFKPTREKATKNPFIK